MFYRIGLFYVFTFISFTVLAHQNAYADIDFKNFYIKFVGIERSSQGPARYEVCIDYTESFRRRPTRNNTLCEPLNDKNIDRTAAFSQFFLLTKLFSSSRSVQSKTNDISVSLNGLNNQMRSLSDDIRKLNGDYIATIRDQIVAKLNSLPLRIIEDPSVRDEIRGMVIKEVDSALDQRRDMRR